METRIVTVCAWCKKQRKNLKNEWVDTSALAIDLARSAGVPVSDGMCPSCVEIWDREIDKQGRDE